MGGRRPMGWAVAGLAFLASLVPAAGWLGWALAECRAVAAPQSHPLGDPRDVAAQVRAAVLFARSHAPADDEAEDDPDLELVAARTVERIYGTTGDHLRRGTLAGTRELVAVAHHWAVN